MNMNEFNKYSFFLSLIVFVLLAGFFTLLIAMLMGKTEKLIACGGEDEAIVKEYTKVQKKGKKKDGKIFYVGNILLSLVFLAVFAFATFINLQENSCSKKIPTPRVVQSTSMANKNVKNNYLTENGLNDQLYMYDVVFTYKLPDEMDLQLYDIVVYEDNGRLIIHRIIQIEEPNEAHPDCRYFRLQGDAVDRPDVFPVTYQQMRGIYTGQRIPFLGSFIMFLQSIAGWLCTALLFFALLFSPLLDKRLENLRKKRYEYLMELQKQSANGSQPLSQEACYAAFYCWYAGTVELK